MPGCTAYPSDVRVRRRPTRRPSISTMYSLKEVRNARGRRSVIRSVDAAFLNGGVCAAEVPVA